MDESKKQDVQATGALYGKGSVESVFDKYAKRASELLRKKRQAMQKKKAAAAARAKVGKRQPGTGLNPKHPTGRAVKSHQKALDKAYKQ